MKKDDVFKIVGRSGVLDGYCNHSKNISLQDGGIWFVDIQGLRCVRFVPYEQINDIYIYANKDYGHFDDRWEFCFGFSYDTESCFQIDYIPANLLNHIKKLADFKAGTLADLSARINKMGLNDKVNSLCTGFLRYIVDSDSNKEVEFSEVDE